MTTAYIFANLGIVVGYFVLGAIGVFRLRQFVRRMVPFAELHLQFSVVGAAGFFVTCGFHHLEGVLHLVFTPLETHAEMATSWHMVINDSVQVVCVWMLLIGTYYEFWRPVTRALESEASRAL